MNRYEIIRNNLRLRDLSRIVFKYDYYLKGKTENSFKLYSEGYLCVVLDNNHIACRELESSVIDIWNINTGVKVRSLYGHLKKIDNIGQEIEVLQLLPDGRLISGSTDTTLRIWNWHTGECELILEGNDSVSKLILLSSGKLAVGYFNGIKIWNLDTLQVELEMQKDEIEHHSFLEINNHIVNSSYEGGNITLFNLKTGKIESYHSVSKDGCPLEVFNKDSFIGISREDQLNIWKVENDELKIEKSFEIPGIMDFFVLQDKIIYSVLLKDGYGVRLLDPKNELTINLDVLNNYLTDVRVLPDNTLALVSAYHLNIYDLEDNTLKIQYIGHNFHELRIIGNKLLAIHYTGDLTVLK